MTDYLFCKLCENNLISCSCFCNIKNNGTYVMPASEARPGSSGPAITTQAPNIKLIKSKHGAHPGKSDVTPNVLVFKSKSIKIMRLGVSSPFAIFISINAIGSIKSPSPSSIN